MADFFIIGEIIKYFDFSPGELFYYRPFVYQVKISIQYDLQSYFITIFRAEDTTRKEYIFIQGVFVNLRNFYPPQESINDCIDNEETSFFDIQNQLLYIHFNHNVNPVFSSVEYGQTFGYTNYDENGKVKQFNGIDYDPEIISIPNFQERVDPLQYTKQSFYGGNIIKNNMPTLPNNEGSFDKDTKLLGNDYNILVGTKGDNYDDLIKISKTYITNPKTSMERINISVKDKREQESIKVPIDTFELSEFPHIDVDLIGKIKPDGYGSLGDVPGICVNSNELGTKLWYFCSQITPGDFFVFAKKNDNWNLVAPLFIDYDNGLVELSISDSYVDGDSDNGLNEIKATGIFIDFLDNKPPDIIRHMNDRFMKISFNESNYNISEWLGERKYLKPVGLYMDNQRNIYEWFGILQSSSTVGFLYLIDNGKRTIRLDNPNRNPIIDIESTDIINNNKLEKNDNAELFATHARVYYKKKYSKSNTGTISNIISTALRSTKRSSISVTYYESGIYENRDYYDSVFKIHRKEKLIELETLLIDEQDAIDKSIIIMEDQQKTRPLINIEVWGRKYFELRLYDIINAELSFPGKIKNTEYYPDYLFSVSSSDDYLFSVSSSDDYLFVVKNSDNILINKREFMGWQRMQIIGRKFNFNLGTITLTLRQRDFSEKFQDITGFIPI